MDEGELVCTLQAGNYFGQLAFSTAPKVRQYTCKANSYLVCLIVDTDNYESLTTSAENRKEFELVSYLRSLPLFKIMSLSNLKKFSHYLKPYECIIHHVLFKESTPAT